MSYVKDSEFSSGPGAIAALDGVSNQRKVQQARKNAVSARRDQKLASITRGSMSNPYSMGMVNVGGRGGASAGVRVGSVLTGSRTIEGSGSAAGGGYVSGSSGGSGPGGSGGSGGLTGPGGIGSGGRTPTSGGLFRVAASQAALNTSGSYTGGNNVPISPFMPGGPGSSGSGTSSGSGSTSTLPTPVGTPVLGNGGQPVVPVTGTTNTTPIVCPSGYELTSSGCMYVPTPAGGTVQPVTTEGGTSGGGGAGLDSGGSTSTDTTAAPIDTSTDYTPYIVAGVAAVGLYLLFGRKKTASP